MINDTHTRSILFTDRRTIMTKLATGATKDIQVMKAQEHTVDT